MNPAGEHSLPEGIIARAKALGPVPMAVVNAGSPAALETARAAQREGIVEPLLIGDADDIRRFAGELDWELRDVRVLNAASAEAAADCAAQLARDGEVAALLKGDIASASYLRAILKRENGLRTGRILSHVFHMSFPDGRRDIYITDGAMNVAPDVAMRVEIARNAIELLHAVGVSCPRVAVLSAIEYETEAMPSSLEAGRIVEACSSIAGALFAGPMALDLAVSPAAAALKNYRGPVAGNADLLLVPTIETGNALFKSLVHFSGAVAAGIVLGAKVPAALGSRGDPLSSRVASAALAALRSGMRQG